MEQAVQSSIEFGSHFGLCAAALYVRAAGMQVRAALPIGCAELPARLRSCTQDSHALREVNEQHMALWSKPAQDATSARKTILSRDVTANHAQTTITDAATGTRDRIKAELDEIDRVITSTQESLATTNITAARGLMLEVTIAADGSVLSASRIAA